MSIYRCECCNFTAKTKQNYEVHLKSKKHINNISKTKDFTDINVNPDLKHMMDMLNKRMTDIENQNIVLVNQNIALKKEIESLKTQIQNTDKNDNTQINYNGNGDINYHIHLTLAKYPSDTEAFVNAISENLPQKIKPN